MADNTVNLVLPSTGLTLSQWVNEVTTINCTSAKTAEIDCNTANTFIVNLDSGGDEHTFTLKNLAVGQTVKLTIVQGAASGTVVWGGTGNQTIRWTNNNTPPILATDPDHADTIILYSPVSGVIGGTLALANF